MKRLYAVSAVAAVLFVTSSATAAPIQWGSASGGNDHWYELVVSSTVLTWHEAKSAAEAAGGYLVTVTSQAETDFIVSAFGAQDIQLAWLGAYQDRNDPAYSEPSGGWKWITGEPWLYTNWEPASHEPNNSKGIEDWIDFHGDSPSVVGSWADIPSDSAGHFKYMVEYVPEPHALLLLISGMPFLGRPCRRRSR